MGIAYTINTVFPWFMAIYMTFVFIKSFMDRQATDCILYDIFWLLIGCCVGVLVLFGIVGGLVWMVVKTLTLCGATIVFNWTVVRGLIMLWCTSSTLYKILKRD
jgi:hypothetical protein